MEHKSRKHIRLRNFDYSSDGMYFITICTHEREWFFGHVDNHKMQLNAIGKMAEQFLKDIPLHFSNAIIDEYILMPNHIHAIIILDRLAGPSDGPAESLRPRQAESVRPRHVVAQKNEFGKPIAGSISVIIQQFKSSLKRWCNKNEFSFFKWQSRFHDHVIRNEQSYLKIKNYIIHNPEAWNTDLLKTKN